jgi:hypothetical protein
MANIRTYEITFAHLSEYSSPISVYSGSLLQPLSITVGEWFATSSGTVALLSSYDNKVYNAVYSTTAFNNSVIYLSIPSFVGSFIKIQRSVSQNSQFPNTTVNYDSSNPQIIFSEPQNININDEIWAGPDYEFFLGVSKNSTVQSVTCTLTSPPLYTGNFPFSIISKTPSATGAFACSFIDTEITSIDITY